MTEKQTRPVKIDPWSETFCEPDVRIARALKAVSAGEATSEQQIQAMDWIQNYLCVVGANAFIDGKPDVRDWRLGRQWVGQHIRRILATKTEFFRKPGEEET